MFLVTAGSLAAMVTVPIGPGMELSGSEEHPARQVRALRRATLNIIDLVQVNKRFFAVSPIHSAIQFWVVADVDV